MTITPYFYNALDVVNSWANASERVSWSPDSPYTAESKFLRQVAARVGNAVLIPFSLLATSVDGVIGLGLGAISLISFGRYFNDSAYLHLRAFALPISCVIECGLRLLNPQAYIYNGMEREERKIYIGGFLARTLLFKSAHLTYSLTQSNTGIVKHVVSRIVPLVTLPLVAIAITADFIISTVLSPFLFLTLGTFDRNTINKVIINGFFGLGFIPVAYCLIRQIQDPSNEII